MRSLHRRQKFPVPARAGVRLAEAVPQDMIAMPLGPQARHVVVGAPSYFANRPKPKKPADLMNHECIRVRHSSGSLSRAKQTAANTEDFVSRTTCCSKAPNLVLARYGFPPSKSCRAKSKRR
jgi:DNA-binding transcriptional LysR family regulator